MKNLQLMLFVFFIFLVESCSVRSTQLSALINFFDEPPSILSSNSWSVNYGEYSAVVFAVSMPNGILFANNRGDQILFDGWVLRVIKGMGNSNLNIKIDNVDEIRTFKQNNRLVELHNCENWRQEKSFKVIRYYQRCGDKQEYVNRILVLEDESISLIRQIIDERYTALTLTKLK